MGLPHAARERHANVEAEDQPRPSRRRAALLINLGSPDRPDVPSVRRYLAEFLSDPAVIRLPRGLGWLNAPLGRMIARFRAPRSAKLYQGIWTERGSPLLAISQDQASALEAILPGGWRVFHAMRYGRPGIAETLRAIEQAGIDELVVVPMYPQFSGTTTGTALQVLYGQLKHAGRQIHVTTRNTWYDDHGYINAQSELIDQYARSSCLTPENTFLLFSAHGLPVSYVQRGDPYPEHVARSVGLVARRLGWPADRMSIAYQSRFGPVEWLKPSTDEMLRQLAHAGEKRVLVCPISFTVDCLETLEEIDVRYRAGVEAAGAELYLCPALDTYTPFISALKHLVLRGPRPMSDAATKTLSIPISQYETPSGNGLNALVMVGMSVRGRLDPDRGPKLNDTDAAGLRCVKRSQVEVPDLLRSVQENTKIREALLWNTCHRFEFYGWLDDPRADRVDVVDQIRRDLFGNGEADRHRVNVLCGAAAWHHLLRTAVGLNSSLPGERDILGQLQAAHRLAERAGTSGPLGRRVVEDVAEFDRNLRADTTWGRYDPEYCHAAMTRLVEAANLDLPACRIVVIGGSTTSAAALRTLIHRFDVSARQLTLLYRGHKNGGQMKMLRKAIANGRRIRVHDYTERCVQQTIAEADVVIFGIDRKEPVLSADQLRDLRDWPERPLTVFDFNLFGSTDGLSSLAGVTVYDGKCLEREVTAYADEMCQSQAFAQAVEIAETRVMERVSEDRRRGETEPSTLAEACIPCQAEPPARLEKRCRQNFGTHGSNAAMVTGSKRS